ncbi:MAG TPA: hypothetical protein VFQ51_17050 [Vicinamibacteria bacterium]|nr:hypothetical protein [Vicinamibacteria bacterium]
MLEYIAFPPMQPLEERSALRQGSGNAVAHHGEILQGVFEVPRGCLCRALVTLRSEVFWSEATFSPDSSGVVVSEDGWRVKAARAVELAVALSGVTGCGGRLRIRSNIPPGWGLGSSTSDVTAAVRAVGESLGVQLSQQMIAELAVKAETASDSTMFDDRALLFAQRRGVLIEDLGDPLPNLEVLGFNTDPAGVDTVSFPPARYSWEEIEAFRPLLGLLRQAVRRQEPELCGRVATASARINQRYLPKPHFNRLEKLVESVGAVGLQVAHSGTVVGLLFEPADVAKEDRIGEARAALAELGVAGVWRFQTRPGLRRRPDHGWREERPS